jgi:hypothetical protein
MDLKGEQGEMQVAESRHELAMVAKQANDANINNLSPPYHPHNLLKHLQPQY